MERSRSGRGGHVWIFFDQAIPAALARRLAAHLLTETMEGRPDIGLDSCDRLFPNQDTLPQGGFGNLIALPLQKGPRERGYSVFLDGRLVPCDDQWAYLSRIRRVGRAQVEHLAQDAERRGRVLGVRLRPRKTATMNRGPCHHPVAIGNHQSPVNSRQHWSWSWGTRSYGALVDRSQLLDQWVERLSTFLGVPAKSIGRIGGGRNTPTGLLDVAVIQSLVEKGAVDDRGRLRSPDRR